MKFNVRHLFVGLMIMTLTAAVALGKDGKTKKETVTFVSDVTVNGTKVKAGEYVMKFNEETGTLEIRSGSKVVATANARLEQAAAKARATTVHTTISGDVEQLTSIALGGKTETIVLAGTSTNGQD